MHVRKVIQDGTWGDDEAGWPSKSGKGPQVVALPPCVLVECTGLSVRHHGQGGRSSCTMPMFAAGHYPGTIPGNLIHLMAVGTSNKGGRMGQHWNVVHVCSTFRWVVCGCWKVCCLWMLESRLSVDVRKYVVCGCWKVCCLWMLERMLSVDVGKYVVCRCRKVCCLWMLESMLSVDVGKYVVCGCWKVCCFWMLESMLSVDVGKYVVCWCWKVCCLWMLESMLS